MNHSLKSIFVQTRWRLLVDRAYKHGTNALNVGLYPHYHVVIQKTAMSYFNDLHISHNFRL